MLTGLEVVTRQLESLSLSFDEVLDGLSVDDIDGLEPVKATLVSSSFAQIDGAQHHSSRREPRNIKITLGLDPDYVTESVRDLRHRLYRWFMPKKEITLRFHSDDDTHVEIQGHVESFDEPLFTKEPQAVISVMCYDPDFIDASPEVYENGTVSTSQNGFIDYDGSVETGIIFRLLVNRALPAFTIYHIPPDGTLRTMDFTVALAADDVLTINTNTGEKRVVRTRAGVETSQLYGLTPQSHWIELEPGRNEFRVYAEGAQIPYTVEYIRKYGGL